MDLSGVNGITAVMSLVVAHIFNQFFALTQMLEDGFDYIDIGPFIMAANIIDFTNLALFQNQIDSSAVLFHKEPITDIEAVAIHRQLLICQSIDKHQRNQLFWKMKWTIVVRTTGNGGWHLVGAVIGHYQQIRRCLRCRIRAGSVQIGFLCKEQVRTIQRQIPTNFIRRHLMISVNAILAAGIKQYTRPNDIGLQGKSPDFQSNDLHAIPPQS